MPSNQNNGCLGNGAVFYGGGGKEAPAIFHSNGSMKFNNWHAHAIAPSEFESRVRLNNREIKLSSLTLIFNVELTL